MPNVPDAIFPAAQHAHTDIAFMSSTPFDTEALGHDIGTRAVKGTVVLLKGFVGGGCKARARRALKAHDRCCRTTPLAQLARRRQDGVCARLRARRHR
jgi:hypothetical protein